MKKQEWEKKLRKTIELWKYKAGDDVLASALADVVIDDVKVLLATALAERDQEIRKKANRLDKYLKGKKVKNYHLPKEHL